MPSEMVAFNSTTSAISSFSDYGGASWFSLMIIVAIVTILLLLFTIALSSITRYRKLRGIIEWCFKTVQYFFFGLGGLGVLAVPTLILFYFGSQASKGNTVPIQITILIIVGYFVIAGLGYIFKHYIVDRIKKFEKEYNKKKPQNEKRKKDKTDN